MSGLLLPKITYPAAAPTSTLNFTYPPVEKPGADDLDAMRTDSFTLSGLRQSMWLRTDVFKHLVLKFVPMADLADFNAFMLYALQGGSFLYYPDATASAYDEWLMESSGGSAPSSAGSSSTAADAWSPTYAFRGFAEFELWFRKVPGGISSGAPDIPSADLVTIGSAPAPPSSVVTVTPTPIGTPPVPASGTEDMQDWIIMGTGGTPDRATQHLQGVNQSGSTTLYYAYLDTSTAVTKVWQIKTAVGNPWDVLLVDAIYIYHWITEYAPGWSIARDFKRINRAAGYPTAEGVPVMPRTFAPGAVGTPSAVTINSPKPNPQNDFISCVSQPQIELGDFQGITHGLYSLNFGGDVGTQDTIIVTVYRGTFGNFKVRENFYYVKFWGFVKWESQSLSGGVWTSTQSSVHNLLKSGGGLSPNFPCGMSFSWWL